MSLLNLPRTVLGRRLDYTVYWHLPNVPYLHTCSEQISMSIVVEAHSIIFVGPLMQLTKPSVLTNKGNSIDSTASLSKFMLKLCAIYSAYLASSVKLKKFPTCEKQTLPNGERYENANMLCLFLTCNASESSDVAVKSYQLKVTSFPFARTLHSSSLD